MLHQTFFSCHFLHLVCISDQQFLKRTCIKAVSGWKVASDLESAKEVEGWASEPFGFFFLLRCLLHPLICFCVKCFNSISWRRKRRWFIWRPCFAHFCCDVVKREAAAAGPDQYWKLNVHSYSNHHHSHWIYTLQCSGLEGCSRHNKGQKIILREGYILLMYRKTSAAKLETDCAVVIGRWCRAPAHMPIRVTRQKLCFDAFHIIK